MASGCQTVHKVEGFPESYVGVGIELTKKADKILVVRTIPGGPSEAAGVQPNDEVVAINGRPAQGMSLGEVVTRLRGKPNSQLTLALSRANKKVVVVLKRQPLAKVGEDYQTDQEPFAPQ